jgi:hypothetical protein
MHTHTEQQAGAKQCYVDYLVHSIWEATTRVVCVCAPSLAPQLAGAGDAAPPPPLPPLANSSCSSAYASTASSITPS